MTARHRRGLSTFTALLVLAGSGVLIASGREAIARAPAPTPAPATPPPAVTSAQAVDEARAQIRGHSAALRSAPGEQYRAVDTIVDPDGARHVRFQRTHEGLPVLGGDFVVHSGPGGAFTGATVAQQRAIDVPAAPEVSRERAVEVAGGSSARVVVDAVTGEPVLAWEVTGGDRVVIVDATTGAVRRSHSLVRGADGTGHGLHLSRVPVSTTRRADGTFALVDPDRGGTTVHDALNQDHRLEPGEFAEFSDDDDVWGDGGRADRATDAVDVHHALAQTWDYLFETFGRRGIGDDGKGLTAYVHHRADWVNAAWSDRCQCMFFGDGAPSGKPFTSLDVVAHEMAHGLDSRTANLIYDGESGGLSEASSDIFGTLVEFRANHPDDPPDYLIGEEIELRAPGLRRMDEPGRDGESASCWSPAVKNLDVHHSSGIGNKFFYTLAVGSGASRWGDSPPCGGAAPVTGIGNDRAAQIWYRALNLYMVSTTNFAGAREATLLAAADLYGLNSVEWDTVHAAWPAVGVDGSDPSPTAPEIAAFDTPLITRTGHPVRTRLIARDPQGQPVTFSAGGLPPGITIDRSGLISGTATTKGEFLGGSVTVTDPDGNSTTRLMFWLVKGPPKLYRATSDVTMQVGVAHRGFGATFDDLPDYRVDAPETMTVSATGVPDGLTVSIDKPLFGSYYAGVKGTPTTAGSGTVVLTVTDADGDRASASIPWRVVEATRPALPSGLSVTAGNGTALVEWQQAPAQTGETPVTGWVVRTSPGHEQTVPADGRSLRLSGLDTRRAYTIGVRATSALGDGAGRTVTLDPVALSLTVAPTAVTWGKPATLSGRALRGGSAAMTGVTLTLEQRPAGRSTWSRVMTVKTDARGAWRAAVKPGVTTAYRVTHPGAAGTWPATSATPGLTVRHAITIKASTTRPRANKKIKISGTAKPGRAGVKVTLQRKVGSRWVTVTSARTSRTGAYSISRAFKRGTWTLRVVVAGSAANGSATSTAVRLKVK